jgi:hypothetical protein
MSWKQHAACIGDPGAHWDADLLPSMFLLCMSCPVKAPCLMEGLDHDYRDDVGVWGGTTVEQRNRIRRAKLEPEQAWAESRQSLEVDCGMF